MAPKAYGTCPLPPSDLKFNCDPALAGRIACYNRHYAEHSGYAFGPKITFESELTQSKTGTLLFYDSVSNKPLFEAPQGRSISDFLTESEHHGWPSFRDSEVVWENVRVLEDGETVSVDGTHLGHNLPDRKGNRYCINLVCIAGKGPIEVNQK